MSNENLPKKIGKYEILDVIGKGGFAVVYKAHDPDIDRDVAIKVIHTNLGEGTEGELNYQRFRKEASIVSNLKHNSIATIFDSGKTADGQPYIVMEYIQGRSLRKIIESGETLGKERTVRIIIQICEALQVAHDKKIVHRDIKPDNILVDENGKASLLDFGIARVEDSNLTQANTALGTWSYMSPEQINPTFLKKHETIDGRTDIYSLGVVLYEMVVGKKPFERAPGDHPTKILHDIINAPVPEPVPRSSDLEDDRLKAIMMTAMERDRANRFPSCRDMAKALNSVIEADGEGTAESTFIFDVTKRKYTGSLEQSKSFFAKFKILLLAAGGVAVVVAALLIFRKPVQYDDAISIAVFDTKNSQNLKDAELGFMLDRALSSTTNAKLYPVYLAGTSSRQETAGEKREPAIQIGGTVTDDSSASGFGITLNVTFRGRANNRVFPFKGPGDLLDGGIDAILKFIGEVSGNVTGPIESGRKFIEVCTSNWDALSEFVDGLDHWKSLDTDAEGHFKNAIDKDNSFALALLKCAEVELFNEDYDKTKKRVNDGLGMKARSTDSDQKQFQAIQERLAFNPLEEIRLRRELAQKFSQKKEYAYDLAEAYFHTADADNAIRGYNGALKLDKDYAIAYNHLAFCFSWKGAHAEAVNNLKDYVRLSDAAKKRAREAAKKPAAGEDIDANAHDSLATGYMFKGEYENALSELEKARNAQPGLEYIYGDLATNLIFLGRLQAAVDNIRICREKSESSTAEVDANSNYALVEILRGNYSKATAYLDKAKEFYRNSEILEEAASLPFWLSGLIAYKQNKPAQLAEAMSFLKKSVDNYKLGPNKYFPVYKFYRHLCAMDSVLKKSNLLKEIVDEASKDIKDKMGYWTSKFNAAYFLTEYAGLLFEASTSASQDRALDLLKTVKEYNDSYAPAHILRAKILLVGGKMEEARQECAAARKLLPGADRDYVGMKELDKIEAGLH